MKYLRQENNRFIFEDGGEELILVPHMDCYVFKCVIIRDDLKIATNVSWVNNEDIQTAVQMMTILKEKGLV